MNGVLPLSLSLKCLPRLFIFPEPSDYEDVRKKPNNSTDALIH